MPPSPNEALDFILIRQKEYILDLINKRKFSEARHALQTVRELWVVNNYEYKYLELKNKIFSKSYVNDDESI